MASLPVVRLSKNHHLGKRGHFSYINVSQALTREVRDIRHIDLVHEALATVATAVIRVMAQNDCWGYLDQSCLAPA